MKVDWKILLLIYSVALILYIIGAVVIFRNDPQYIFFWVPIIFAMLILMISTYVSRTLSDKSDNKIDGVLDILKRIEEKVDGLHKKNKSIPIEITEQAWHKLRKDTLYNVKAIIDNVRTLDENNVKNGILQYREPFVAGFLYTHAYEEFGKLLIFQSYKPENGKVTINQKNELRDHHVKFEEANKNPLLPTECKTVFKTILSTTSYTPDANKLSGIQVLDNMPITFEARTSLIHTDIDSNGNLKKKPVVDREPFSLAVSKFVEFIDSFQA